MLGILRTTAAIMLVEMSRLRFMQTVMCRGSTTSCLMQIATSHRSTTTSLMEINISTENIGILKVKYCILPSVYKHV